MPQEVIIGLIDPVSGRGVVARSKSNYDREPRTAEGFPCPIILLLLEYGHCEAAKQLMVMRVGACDVAGTAHHIYSDLANSAFDQFLEDLSTSRKDRTVFLDTTRVARWAGRGS